MMLCSKTCTQCGIEFESRENRASRGQFCSRECLGLSQRKTVCKRISLREVTDGCTRYGLSPTHGKMLASRAGFLIAHPLLVVLISRRNMPAKSWRPKIRAAVRQFIGSSLRQADDNVLREFTISSLISMGFTRNYIDGFIRGCELRGIDSPVEDHIFGFEDGTAVRKGLL